MVAIDCVEMIFDFEENECPIIQIDKYSELLHKKRKSIIKSQFDIITSIELIL